jgi:hypothetical protein
MGEDGRHHLQQKEAALPTWLSAPARRQLFKDFFFQVRLLQFAESHEEPTLDKKTPSVIWQRGHQQQGEGQR